MIIYFILFLILSVAPVIWLNIVFSKNDKVLVNMPFTGLEFGKIILKEMGLKEVKIEKSLQMLEKANKIKSNDPYITDSLGWALFKLKRFKEAKDYLQLAVRLMPGDPIVNDHFGDVLWKNGNELQARYYWNYVLKLEKTEDELKKSIKEKLIQGL